MLNDIHLHSCFDYYWPFSIIIVQRLKRQVHNMYLQDVADEQCRRLDEAKKKADVWEHLYNVIQ